MPEMVREEFRSKAMDLHWDLTVNFQEVVLMPASEPKHCGHMVRVAVNQNPSWFKELISIHGKDRMRRGRVLTTLQRIMDGKDLPRANHGRIRETIFNMIYKTEHGEFTTFHYNPDQDEVPF